jgi:uncharacterized protein YoxC
MLLTISATVIAAIMVILLIFLIPVIFQIRRTVRKIERLVDTASVQISPLTKSVRTLSMECERILQSICRQVEMVEDGITDVQKGILRLRVFQEEVQKRVEEPIFEFTALLTAMARGLETFLHIFRR